MFVKTDISQAVWKLTQFIFHPNAHIEVTHCYVVQNRTKRPLINIPKITPHSQFLKSHDHTSLIIQPLSGDQLSKF